MDLWRIVPGLAAMLPAFTSAVGTFREEHMWTFPLGDKLYGLVEYEINGVQHVTMVYVADRLLVTVGLSAWQLVGITGGSLLTAFLLMVLTVQFFRRGRVRSGARL